MIPALWDKADKRGEKRNGCAQKVNFLTIDLLLAVVQSRFSQSTSFQGANYNLKRLKLIGLHCDALSVFMLFQSVISYIWSDTPKPFSIKNRVIPSIRHNSPERETRFFQVPRKIASPKLIYTIVPLCENLCIH
jgi:hypothetical protein